MTTTSRVSKCLFSGSPKYFYPSYPLYIWTFQASNCFVKICLTLIHPKLRAKLCRFVWGQHSGHSWEVPGCFLQMELPRDDTMSYHSSHLPPKPAVMSWFFDIGIVVCAYNQAPNHINKFRKPLQLAQLHSRLCDGFRFSTCGCSKRVAVWCNSCRAPLEVSF